MVSLRLYSLPFGTGFTLFPSVLRGAKRKLGFLVPSVISLQASEC